MYFQRKAEKLVFTGTTVNTLQGRDTDSVCQNRNPISGFSSPNTSRTELHMLQKKET
jgi:hypothetical protein